jgi:hypothetical protein
VLLAKQKLLIRALFLFQAAEKFFRLMTLNFLEGGTLKPFQIANAEINWKWWWSFGDMTPAN